MGNLCTKDLGEDYMEKKVIIFEQVMDVNPKKFNSNYSIKWDNNIEVWLFSE